MVASTVAAVFFLQELRDWISTTFYSSCLPTLSIQNPPIPAQIVPQRDRIWSYLSEGRMGGSHIKAFTEKPLFHLSQIQILRNLPCTQLLHAIAPPHRLPFPHNFRTPSLLLSSHLTTCIFIACVCEQYPYSAAPLLLKRGRAPIQPKRTYEWIATPNKQQQQIENKLEWHVKPLRQHPFWMAYISTSFRKTSVFLLWFIPLFHTRVSK